MRISRIVVAGLFDRFNHDLRFKTDERITIMIGPNGFGKTTILRIINALFNHPLSTLTRMPFRQVTVYFDDGSQLEVLRQLVSPNELKNKLDLIYRNASGEEKRFTPEKWISPKELPFPLGIIEDIIPVLDQIGVRQWRHRLTGETLTIEDVLERFQDELPEIEGDSSSANPPWLQDVRKSISVHFIDTERLTRPLLTDRKRRTRFERAVTSSERTVRHNSEDLAARVQKTLAEYGTLAQSLDRTFPARLVGGQAPTDSNMDTLRRELGDVESRRSQLVEAGLLKKESTGWEVAPDLGKVDDSKRGVLVVFAQDAKQKLSVFDDLYSRVDTFKRIANSRFLYKMVTVGPEGLGVKATDDSQLDLEMLSSGEQHELVLLYDLLFRVPNNALILIDEPELSLHVAWQEEFLKDLQEIAKLSEFHALLATHSPVIIGDRWDLTMELKGPNGK
jgi:predicted ATP-dependent endonuclease of OLD family